jgi:hypothetical protein
MASVKVSASGDYWMVALCQRQRLSHWEDSECQRRRSTDRGTGIGDSSARVDQCQCHSLTRRF